MVKYLFAMLKVQKPCIVKVHMFGSLHIGLLYLDKVVWLLLYGTGVYIKL